MWLLFGRAGREVRWSLLMMMMKAGAGHRVYVLVSDISTYRHIDLLSTSNSID